MKIRTTPRLFSRRLRDLHAAFPELLEQPLNILDFDGGQDQGGFPRGELREVRLVDEAKVQADVVA